MKFTETTKSLLTLSFVAILINIARLDMWGTTNLLYLIWNLFLAWIPYFISASFIKPEMKKSSFALLFMVWILFLPNAPYLVTDVLHIAKSTPAFIWYDSLVFFLFGWIGLMLGLISMMHIHGYLKNIFNKTWSEFSMFFVCLVSSLGIYLGRFERWNSWDVVADPFKIIKHSTRISSEVVHTKTGIIFILVFTIFLYAVYRFFYSLMKNKTLVADSNVDSTTVVS